MSRSSTRTNNINKWSEKINLLITNFTLYEPECENYKMCGKKITNIYGQIQLYINNPRLIYTNNPLDVFILPELESDKKYNEAFNKILYYYYTPLFSADDFKNPIYLQLVIDYRDLLKKTTLIKIDNCRDKYDILENLGNNFLNSFKRLFKGVNDNSFLGTSNSISELSDDTFKCVLNIWIVTLNVWIDN